MRQCGHGLGALALALACFATGIARGQSLRFDVLAGAPSSAGAIDGIGVDARFGNPQDLAIDASGNIFVADNWNASIRRVSPGGEVTTVAGVAGLSECVDGGPGVARLSCPFSVEVDSAGNLFVADFCDHAIRKIDPTGNVTTVAGIDGAYGHVDATGRDARFDQPVGLALDGAGNLYVSEFFNCTIRKITPAGAVTTIAGQPQACVDADGVGTAATFGYPGGLALDPTGASLFVADSEGTIRRIDLASGAVSTFAGTALVFGTDDGVGAAASFLTPWRLAFDPAGDLYVADEGAHTIRKITPGALVTTLAGTPEVPGTADGTGTAATFTMPEGIAFDPTTGGLVVADGYSRDLRRVSLPGAMVSRLSGTSGGIGWVDGVGTNARFNFPGSIARDGSTLYVADTSNYVIRKIDAAGVVTTLAGSAGNSGSADGTGAAARFYSPTGVAVDVSGDVFVADRLASTIRRVTPAGVVTTWAGQALTRGSTDGLRTAARFRNPRGVACDGLGNVYVADTSNHLIRKIDAAGNVTTLAGEAGVLGSSDGIGVAAHFAVPVGIAADAAGNVYVGDTGNGMIRKIAPGGVVTTLAGVPTFRGTADGAGATARFGLIGQLALDAADNILVADSARVRKVTPDGVVTTIAGSADRPVGTMGTGRDVRFIAARGVVTDAGGNLIVVDSETSTIWRSAPALEDAATIDAPRGPVGEIRQLDTQPQTATSWRWDVVRRPSPSVAALSSTSIRDPTFTPDVADVHVFQVASTDGALESLTLAWQSAGRTPVVTAADSKPAHGRVRQIVVLLARDLATPLQVLFSDGTSPTIASPRVFADVERGLVAAEVPAGARTGPLRLVADGFPGLPYWFRVDGLPFIRGTSVVSGVVTGPGGPVAGAVVVLLRDDGCGGQDTWDAAVTDASGAYSMLGANGDYLVTVFAPIGAAAANASEAVTLGAAPVTRDVTLATGTTVRGSVTLTGTGRGVADCRIVLEGVVPERLLTDSEGRFSAQLEPGNWTVRGEPPPGTNHARVEQPLVVGAASPQDEPPMALAQGFVIRGRARVAADLTPLSAGVVTAMATNPCCAESDRVVVAGDGTYAVVVPANTAHELRLDLDDDAAVGDVMVAVTGNDINLDAGAASAIDGLVTDPGGMPLGCIEVVATRSPWPGTEVATTLTCADGTYRLGVPDGARYLVSTRATADPGCTGTPVRAAQSWDGSVDGTWFPCEAVAVPVPPGGGIVPGIDFVLPLAATISGSFLSGASSCASIDVSLDSSILTIDDGTSHACGMGVRAASAPGTYLVEQLPPSTSTTLRACAAPPAPELPQCWDGQAPPAFDPITVLGGGSAVADFCFGATASNPVLPITGLRVRKSDPTTLVLTWDASVDPAHVAYRLRGAVTARPAVLPGAWPTDPAFADLNALDADGSDTDTSFTLAVSASPGYFLIVDTGATADGPCESYGG